MGAFKGDTRSLDYSSSRIVSQKSKSNFAGDVMMGDCKRMCAAEASHSRHDILRFLFFSFPPGMQPPTEP